MPLKRIHLDHNATTPLRAEAREALLEALDAGLGNPSSVHDAGRRARAAVDTARERVAAALDVDEDSVVFTGGGTEANNLALLGSIEAAQKRPRVITTAAEHAAVLGPVEAAARQGCDVKKLGVDAYGAIDLDELRHVAAARGPLLVSIMAANNEVGATSDLAQIREAIGAAATFHSDAVQALGKVPLDLAAVDLASLSAHKVGGPLGVGVLVRRTRRPLAARSFGGAQEAELRPGTENVPAIAAAAVAIELAVREQSAFAKHIGSLTRQLWDGIRGSVPSAVQNGPPLDDPTRLPNTLNVSFDAGDARTLVTRLDLVGIEVSRGSACASGSVESSHVLRAMFGDDPRAARGVRMSLGRTTTAEDVHTIVERLRTSLGSRS